MNDLSHSSDLNAYEEKKNKLIANFEVLKK